MKSFLLTILSKKIFLHVIIYVVEFSFKFFVELVKAKIMWKYPKKTKLFRMGIWFGCTNNLPFSGLTWTFEILSESKPLMSINGPGLWIFKIFSLFFFKDFLLLTNCWNQLNYWVFECLINGTISVFYLMSISYLTLI